MVRRKLPLDLGHDAEWLVRAYIAECHGWSVEVDVAGGAGAALCPRRGSDHDADHGVVRIVGVGRCYISANLLRVVVVTDVSYDFNRRRLHPPV